MVCIAVAEETSRSGQADKFYKMRSPGMRSFVAAHCLCLTGDVARPLLLRVRREPGELRLGISSCVSWCLELSSLSDVMSHLAS
jgi:hypothetical protein